MMDTCLCSSLHHLAQNYDEGRARELIPALNSHLKDIFNLLNKSVSLCRDLQYRITPSNDRTNKVLSVTSVNLAPVDRAYEKFIEDIDGFWSLLDDNDVHTELRRRLACVVIFLRSRLNLQVLAPPQIARLFHGQPNYSNIRSSGRKYIQIARKLGGLGAILWLPLDISPSTYERYLSIDDEETFSHLVSLDPQFERYTGFVQRLIISQLHDQDLDLSYYNLFIDHVDFIPPSDQLLLVLHALGGFLIPDALFRSVRFPQRRWNSDGEIETTNAAEFGLPKELAILLSNEFEFSKTMSSRYLTKHILDDNTVAWSLHPEFQSILSKVLNPAIMDEIGAMTLKLICFVCPPCYEGNTNWSMSLKKALWPILESASKTYKIQTSLRTQVLEAILYFAERDSIIVRRAAVEHARKIVRKSMPYYLQASVVLFQSILTRVDGEFAKSEGQIRDFTWRGPRPATRRDYALEGRLHISQMENKIKCYDNDVPSFMYKWKAKFPLSALDIEVTLRLQSTAARYFQLIGDFDTARASLEQFITLETTKPTRASTRRIMVSRLADIYCEMGEFTRAAQMLEPELVGIDEVGRSRREFRRLLSALVECNIGLRRLEAAKSVLHELEGLVSPEMEDIHDQQLRMRMVIAAARISHVGPDRDEAVQKWRFALELVERMHTLNSTEGFTAGIIHLSLAHAQIIRGDRDSGRSSWAAGSEILNHRKYEFWMPIVPTVWLQHIASKVYELEGWSLNALNTSANVQNPI